MFTLTIDKKYILSIVLKPLITPCQSSPSFHGGGLQFYLASLNNFNPITELLACSFTLLISFHMKTSNVKLGLPLSLKQKLIFYKSFSKAVELFLSVSEDKCVVLCS